MVRRLVDFCAWVSLAACAVSAAAWAGSHVRCGEWRLGTGRPDGVAYVLLGLGPGELGAGTMRERLDVDDPDARRQRRFVWFPMSYPAAAETPHGRLGFDRFAFRTRGSSLGRTGRESVQTFDTVGVPLWAVCLTTAVLPAVRFRARRRLRRRERLGLCLRCGYDLRATPGRCPECGASAGPEDST